MIGHIIYASTSKFDAFMLEPANMRYVSSGLRKNLINMRSFAKFSFPKIFF